MTKQRQMTVRHSRLYGRLTILGLAGMGLAAQLSVAAGPDDASPVNLVPVIVPIPRDTAARVGALTPFTHVVSIPANADPETIRFERLRQTKVSTRRKVTLDPGYCHDLQFRAPGGSMYCPYVCKESPVTAYEVTYSYKGQPLASDEYGNPNFTFQVFFHSEELPPDMREAISGSKLKRSDLANYFNVTVFHPRVRSAVIDEARSKFCDGAYVDGNWIQNDPGCHDEVTVKPVVTPAEYITVEVDPVGLSDWTGGESLRRQ